MATIESASQVARHTARLREITKSTVAARLRVLLSERGMSGRSLAAHAGLGIGTVRELLGGQSDPSLGTMLAIVSALDLGSIEELLAPLGTQLLLRELAPSRTDSESA